ncbi:hypothetical protein OU657_26280 [Escherichia coli]|nr:hypothetical protein [Escherichia coli]
MSAGLTGGLTGNSTASAAVGAHRAGRMLLRITT